MRTAILLLAGVVLGLFLGFGVSERRAIAAERSDVLPPIFRPGKFVEWSNGTPMRIREVFGEWVLAENGFWIHAASAQVSWREAAEPATK